MGVDGEGEGCDCDCERVRLSLRALTFRSGIVVEACRGKVNFRVLLAPMAAGRVTVRDCWWDVLRSVLGMVGEEAR